MLLALVLAQAAVMPPPVADEITVIGRRLQHWTGRVSTTIGITTCRTLKSTGDREIDTIGCTAARQCWPQYRHAMEVASDRKLPADTRREMIATVKADMRPCVTATRDSLIAELADRRAAAKPAS